MYMYKDRRITYNLGMQFKVLLISTVTKAFFFIFDISHLVQAQSLTHSKFQSQTTINLKF